MFELCYFGVLLTGAADGAAEQRLSTGPAIRIGRIRRGLVGEGRRSPLVREHPNVLRGVEE